MHKIDKSWLNATLLIFFRNKIAKETEFPKIIGKSQKYIQILAVFSPTDIHKLIKLSFHPVYKISAFST